VRGYYIGTEYDRDILHSMLFGAFRSALGIGIRFQSACLPRSLPKQLITRPLTTSSPRLRALKFRHFFSTKADASAQLPILPPRSVGSWLMFSSTLVFAVIVVGGVTRLTESGLSITEWRPITGILPPLSQDEWMQEFDKYKATPEFKLYVTQDYPLSLF